MSCVPLWILWRVPELLLERPIDIQSFHKSSGEACNLLVQLHFVIVYCTILPDLVSGLNSACSCGLMLSPCIMETTQKVCCRSFVCTCHQFIVNIQKGHVLRGQFTCPRCHKTKRTWSSCRLFHGHYLVNQK